MTAVSDAERAVAEAVEALIRRLHPWSSDPAEVDATTDALVTAVRRHDAEVVRSLRIADFPDDVQEIVANHVHAVPAAEPPPEVVVRYDSDDALTIRLRDFEVDTIGPGALGIEGRLTSGTGWPRPGNAVRLAELGIPGPGLLADVTASIRLESVDDATIVCIRVALDPKEPTP